MNKQTKKILTWLGVAGLAGGIWWFTRPEPVPAVTVPVPPAPGGNLPPAGPSTPTPPVTTVYPVVAGTSVKIGDTIYPSSSHAGIFKDANGTASGWTIPVGNRAGKVIGITPNYLKMELWTGAPTWDGVAQHYFWIPKYHLYTVRP